MNQTGKAYLSTSEVAQLYGFSVRTITEWAVAWQESGGTEGLPGFKMGRSWRFERKEIQALIDSKKVPFRQSLPHAAGAGTAAIAASIRTRAAAS